MTEPDSRLTICLDARLVSGESGGIEQYVIGLARGMSRLDDGNEEFLFLTFSGEDDWLRPHLAGSCRVIHSDEMPFSKTKKGRIKEAVPFSGAILDALPPLPGLRRSSPSWSNGTIEKAGVQVMHFTGQNAFFTNIPTIYQPHDLQHVHLPHLFSRRERHFREEAYRAHCLRAKAVAMMTSWGAQDIVRHYQIPSSRVVAIPPGSSMACLNNSDALKPGPDERPDLPKSFLLYPAQTWPHKNHLLLLEALASARASGSLIPLVCTGTLNSYYPRIAQKVRELKLGDQVRFTGFLSSAELEMLYKRARGMVYPSLFEGWGMPITEAFSLGLPVACSNATSLPDLVGDSALLFDPLDVQGMARAILRLWNDTSTRVLLASRGKQVAANLSWERTALTFRALYRTVVGREREEDRALLSQSATV